MNQYADRRVLVTGGLGFLGSNLAIRLVHLGADVTILDSLVSGCGGNLRNIDPIAPKVNVLMTDIGDVETLGGLICKTDVIFNLAGEVSHSHSMEFPDRDLALNTTSHLSFLNECVRSRPGVRVVYAGTRQIYGKPQHLPVTESHPVAPVDFNGVHKHATESYHLMLSRLGSLDAVILRFTNVYGPRLAINVACQGFLSVYFLNLALGRPLEIFGDGTQARDPLFVDDAVDALLLAGAEPVLKSRVYNVGGPESLSVAEIARAMSRLTASPPPRMRPFPPDRLRIDVGPVVLSSDLIRRELRWQPNTAFDDGALATLRFFRARLRDYVQFPNLPAKCPLHQPQLVTRKVASE